MYHKRESRSKPQPLIPARVHKRCPVCGEISYSRAGVHPQCSVRQADEKHDSEVKKCLVSVRYHKLGEDPWRRIGRRPQIETYLSDVSEKYRQPRVEHVSPSRVVIRVYDELAVDLTSLIDRLGNYSQAVARCDDCLRNEVLGCDEADFDSCSEPWY